MYGKLPRGSFRGTDQNPPNHLGRSSAAPSRARTALLQGEPGDAAPPQRPEGAEQDDQPPFRDSGVAGHRGRLRVLMTARPPCPIVNGKPTSLTHYASCSRRAPRCLPKPWQDTGTRSPLDSANGPNHTATIPCQLPGSPGCSASTDSSCIRVKTMSRWLSICSGWAGALSSVPSRQSVGSVEAAGRPDLVRISPSERLNPVRNRSVK